MPGGKDVQKLFNADLLDIIPVERGFVYACKETLPEGDDAVAFYIYNQEIDIFEKIPVLTYINAKFGENGADIARSLVDFVTCTVINLAGNNIAVSYPDGRLKILTGSGLEIAQSRVEYLGNPACAPAANGADIWFAVPDSHAIINYSVKHNRIEFRIGSPKEKAFCHPIDVAVYDNKQENVKDKFLKKDSSGKVKIYLVDIWKELPEYITKENVNISVELVESQNDGKVYKLIF
jgi:hypothetical protein